MSASKLDARLHELGCLRQRGGYRHYTNPCHPERITTFPVHPGDMPRGIIADIIEDLGITKEQFYDPKFSKQG